MTSIIVSHDVKETLSIADYVYILSNGSIVGQGQPDTILNSKQPEIEQFLKGLPDGVVPFHYPAMDIRKELIG